MQKCLSPKILFATLIFFIIVPFAQAEDLSQCMQIANKIISKKYKKYELVTLRPKSRPADYFQRKHSDRNPSIICADLDGNDLTDVGLLLKSKEYGGETLKVLLQKNNSDFEEKFTYDADYYATYLLPKTKEKIIEKIQLYEDEVGIKKINLIKNTGIELVFYGKSALTFFWNEKQKRVEEVWTAD